MTLPPPLPRPARPVFVWVIAGYYLVSLVFTGLSLWLATSGLIPLTGPQRAYFSSLSWLDYACTIVIATSNLAGAAMLLLLRRVAVYLFVFALTLGIAFAVYQIVARNWLQAMGPALPGAIFGWALPIAVIVYARYLAKKGVLR